MTANPASDIPRAYSAADVEQRIYQNWLSQGYFTPEVVPGKPSYTIIMPPPNVTGELHLGHALTASIEDALARWRRMSGDATLWLPGKDHAGIATQWVVERLLAEEGTSRQELGREKFQERVWEWVARYGNTIDEQHKRLGTSCDWSRLRFTLDPGPARAVRTTFVNLYRKGLIYRHERIINWCPRCATALSDLEVEYQEQDGKLYYLRYPLAGESGATTAAQPLPQPLPQPPRQPQRQPERQPEERGQRERNTSPSPPPGPSPCLAIPAWRCIPTIPAMPTWWDSR